MQRLFAMFPTAGPGIGLLFLRLAVAAALAAGAGPVTDMPWMPAAFSAGLVAGVVTPVLAALAAAIHLMRVLAAASVDADLLAAVLSAAALALLGPGAYSIDARVYGRRRIVTSTAARE